MKKIVIQTLAVLAVIIFISSCQYKFTVEPVIIPPDPDDTTVAKISFSGKIEPIFKNLNCVSCHQTSGQKPDLTAGNAYNSIMSQGLADTTDPESSSIYQKPLPSGSHYIKYKAQDAVDVLLWIQQGAMNN